MSVRPNFLIIGAGKCGTTSLWSLLGQHPDVFVPWSKEPSFFSTDAHYTRGWKWYESLFRGARGEKAVGEASNSYSATGIHPHTVGRIVRDLPEVKLIYITREPFRRAESDWMESQRVDADGPRLPLAEFLRSDRVSLDKSLYWKQISAYREQVPDERILTLLFEDFRADAASTLRAILEFLEVDPSVPIRDAEEARRPSGRYLADSRLLARVRRLPGFVFLSSRLPRPLVDRLRPLFQREHAQDRPHWEESTRRWYLDRVCEDSHQFLEYAGKPRDFWGF